MPPSNRRSRDDYDDADYRPTSNRRSRDDFDYDDADYRPRRSRSKRKRKKDKKLLVVILIACGLVFGMCLIVPIVCYLTGYYSRPISVEDFNKISKTDTIPELERRFGPGYRLSKDDLESIEFSTQVIGGHQNYELKNTLGHKLKNQYGESDPECYHWQHFDTEMYILVKHGDPKKNLRVKMYFQKGVDAKGNHSGTTIISDFSDQIDLPVNKSLPTVRNR